MNVYPPKKYLKLDNNPTSSCSYPYTYTSPTSSSPSPSPSPSIQSDSLRCFTPTSTSTTSSSTASYPSNFEKNLSISPTVSIKKEKLIKKYNENESLKKNLINNDKNKEKNKDKEKKYKMNNENMKDLSNLLLNFMNSKPIINSTHTTSPLASPSECNTNSLSISSPYSTIYSPSNNLNNKLLISSIKCNNKSSIKEKNKKINKKAEITGRWTSQEHNKFLKGLRKYGKEWKLITSMVKTRTVIQTRTHAQKYFLRLAKAESLTELELEIIKRCNETSVKDNNDKDNNINDDDDNGDDDDNEDDEDVDNEDDEDDEDEADDYDVNEDNEEKNNKKRNNTQVDEDDEILMNDESTINKNYNNNTKKVSTYRYPKSSNCISTLPNSNTSSSSSVPLMTSYTSLSSTNYKELFSLLKEKDKEGNNSFNLNSYTTIPPLSLPPSLPLTTSSTNISPSSLSSLSSSLSTCTVTPSPTLQNYSLTYPYFNKFNYLNNNISPLNLSSLHSNNNSAFSYFSSSSSSSTSLRLEEEEAAKILTEMHSLS